MDTLRVYVMIYKRSFESFMCLDLLETLKESEFSLGLKLYCFSLQRPKQQQQQQKRIVDQMHVPNGLQLRIESSIIVQHRSLFI